MNTTQTAAPTEAQLAEQDALNRIAAILAAHRRYATTERPRVADYRQVVSDIASVLHEVDR